MKIEKANTVNNNAVDITRSPVIQPKIRYTLEDIRKKIEYLDMSIQKFQETKAELQALYNQSDAKIKE